MPNYFSELLLKPSNTIVKVKDTDAQNSITNLTSNLETEITDREQADAQLQSNIDNEVLARQQADAQLQSNIDNEASTRLAVDNALGERITDNYNASLQYTLKRPRNIVVVSDSYGDTNATEGSFIDRAKTILNDIEDITIYNCAKGSTSFSNPTESMNFLGALKEHESQISDKTQITDVIVLGGHNDMGASQTNIATGMENFYNYVANNYPNAKLTVGFIGYTMQDSLTDKWYVAASVYYNLCTLKKMAYTNVFENVLRISSYMKSDEIHPNTNGQIALARALVSWCLNQNTNVSYYISSNNSAITPHTGISISGTPVIESRRFEKTCIIDLMGGLTFTYTGTFTSNSVDNIAIGTLSETVYRGDPTHLQWVPVPAVINNGSNYYTVYGEICFANNLMYFRAYGIDSNLSVGFWNFTNPTVLIGRCTLTFND